MLGVKNIQASGEHFPARGKRWIPSRWDSLVCWTGSPGLASRAGKYRSYGTTALVTLGAKIIIRNSLICASHAGRDEPHPNPIDLRVARR